MELEVRMESDVDSQPMFISSDLPQQLLEENYSQENNALPDANVGQEVADTSLDDDELMAIQEPELVEDAYPYEEEEEIINAEEADEVGEEDFDEFEEEEEEIAGDSNLNAFKGQVQYEDVSLLYRRTILYYFE